MDVFHCNGCGHLPHLPGIDQRRYFLTSCGHIVCVNCASNGNGGTKEQCPVCHSVSRTVEVNQGSNAEIKAYFVDPMSQLSEAYKKFGKIAGFQKAQTKNFQTLFFKVYDMCRKTSAENVALKKDLASCQKENQALKMKIASLTPSVRIPSAGSTPNGSYPGPGTSTPGFCLAPGTSTPSYNLTPGSPLFGLTPSGSTPGFCPAPGAGRPRGTATPVRDRNPSPQQNGNQTPDLSTRLRGLRW